MAVDVRRVLNAVGEPTRSRILELLASRPHTVGEVAAALGSLQPQTTKHLRALEVAGMGGSRAGGAGVGASDLLRGRLHARAAGRRTDPDRAA